MTATTFGSPVWKITMPLSASILNRLNFIEIDRSRNYLLVVPTRSEAAGVFTLEVSRDVLQEIAECLREKRPEMAAILQGLLADAAYPLHL